MRFMRLALAITTALATPAMLLGCDTKKDPSPKPSVPIVTFEWVKVCIENTTQIRQVDARCDEGLPSLHHWVYLPDDPDFLQLPAVAQRLEKGRGTVIEPKGVEVGRVPAEGARFRLP